MKNLSLYLYHLRALLLLWGVMCVISCSSVYDRLEVSSADLPDKIDFNFHVKPILSDRCFNCHGPDINSRKANLRLDLEDTAKAKLASSNGYAIVAGNPSSSAIIQRALHDDVDMKMPPPESNLTLTDKEIAILAKWIEQGAEWKTHWAFVPPIKPIVPDIDDTWVDGNEIDRFISKSLEESSMVPKPEARKETLLRRVYFDLTGLPPAPEEVQSFLADSSPNAYEQVVDRLLASTANAERLTTDWLDIARYADSHGLHADGYRMMWPWRDWVIRSFQSNIPYDEFITKQLAGDLMSDATKDDILATAFNRNHAMTAEGGAIDEEWRLNYVWDRAETISTALMGLTLGCAKCHDHKYDPFSQKEFYEMTAFFNNVNELGMTGDDGNYGPLLMLSDAETDKEIALLDLAIDEQLERVENYSFDPKEMKEYISKLGSGSSHRIGHYAMDKVQNTVDKNGNKQLFFDGNKKAYSHGEDRLVLGQKRKAIQFSKDYNELYIADIDPFDGLSEFSVGMWINTVQLDSSKTQTLIGNAGEKNNFWRGWEMYLDEQNRLNVRLIHALPQNYIHVRSNELISIDEWYHVALSYDGTQTADGLSLLIDGKEIDPEIVYDNLYKSIYSVEVATHVPVKRPLRVGKSYRNYTGENGIFLGMMDDIIIYDKALTAYEITIDAGIEGSDVQPNNIPLRTNKDYAALKSGLKKLYQEKNEIIEPIEEIMVMKETDTPRKTFAYDRGEYLNPIYEVTASTPQLLLPFNKDLPKNRLGLAQWLFNPDHPLTARVTVNRYWQMIFGKGLVKTPEDFGVQGALPTHPELLDWLAITFVESGWDIKSLLKMMVMSNTYRQSSNSTSKDLEIDPDNDLYARGSRYRMPAEMIRDNALVASGLLKPTVGGESVKPYQPEGLWIEKGNFSKILLRYHESHGDSLYRRSLYTFVKRTSPHPMMTTFDAPNREVCVMKRELTSTPLQALVLLNDPQFVEAAKVLAQRIQYEGGDNIREQIAYAYLCALGRQPDTEEIDILMDLYADQYKLYVDNSKDATKYLRVGNYQIDPNLDEPKTAALAVVSNTLLNHDESYIKR